MQQVLNTIAHRERADATRVNRPEVVLPVKRVAHPGFRLVTINNKTVEVPALTKATVLKDSTPRHSFYKKVVRPVNNYVRQFKYQPVSESLTQGKYTMPGIGLAALGTGLGSWVYSLPLLRVPLLVGGYIGGFLGGKAVDGLLKITTGKDFALNVEDYTGLDRDVGGWFNPGTLWGGIKGFRWGTNTTRRAAEVAMRTTHEPNPLSSIKLAIPSIYNNTDGLTGGPRRLFDIGRYVLTGLRTGLDGWSNSLSPVPDMHYRGFFLERAVKPNLEGKADMIDAFLYGKDIDPAYGIKRVATGENFGPHESYVAEQYADKASKIPVYEVENNWTTVPEEVPVKAGEWRSSNGHFGNGLFQTSKGSEVNVGGHLILKGTADIPVQRVLDIWKFKAPEYQDSWDEHGWLVNEGLKTVDHLGTPVITRTPWQVNPNIVNDGVIPWPSWMPE